MNVLPPALTSPNQSRAASWALAATSADWAYQGHRFLVGTTLPPWSRITLELGFEYYQQDYSSANSFSPVGDVVREDKTYSPSVTVSRPLTDRLSLAVQYLYMRAESNIAVFDYQRDLVSLTLAGQF